MAFLKTSEISVTRAEKYETWAGLNRPDSESPDISIVSLPYDGASCFRKGASEAPERIRMLSAEIPAVLETGESLKSLSVRDRGDLPFGNDFVDAFPQIEAAIKPLTHSFVLTLGGDHSVVIPVHRAFGQHAGTKIGMIFIDAHTDLSDRFRGSLYSNACPLRRVMETPWFSPEETVLFGTRCFEPEGLQFIKKHNMRIFPAYQIEEEGVRRVADQIVKQLSHLSKVYLSIDIDVLDPAFAPGTGIPDAGGLSTRDMITLIRALDPLPIVGADLVEVSPPLDVSDITSFAALRIIMEIFGGVLRRKNGVSLL